MHADYFILPGHWKSLYPVHYGHEDCKPRVPIGPYVEENYLVHFILHGKGYFRQNGVSHLVCEDDLFIIHPGEYVSYVPDSEDPWSYVWLSFQCEKKDLIDRPVVHQPIVRGLFEQIRELEGDNRMVGKLFSLTHEIVWMLTTEQTPFRADDYADYAKMWIHSNFNKKISLEEISRDLHIDRHYLCKCFKARYRCSPQEYLMQLRMNKSKEYLARGFSVTTAAGMAGFSDLPNFSKQFKRAFGVSPSQFMEK